MGVGVFWAFLEQGEGKKIAAWQIRSRTNCAYVFYYAPGWFIPNPESLLILLDVGGHVHVGPVDPLKVNLKGSIRKHF